MSPLTSNLTFSLLSLLRSPSLMLNVTGQTTVSHACQQDLAYINHDIRIVSAITKLAVDTVTMGVQMGIQCAREQRQCGDKMCCNQTFNWQTHIDDMHEMAAAVDANPTIKKVCFIDQHQTISAFSVQLLQDFKLGGVFPIGHHCSPSDVAELLRTVSDSACRISPLTTHCGVSLNSASCGGGGGGCTEWKTLKLLWPSCDAPTDHTPWSVNLEYALGPQCVDAAADQCCYVPLGYEGGAMGGAPFGSPCAKVCAEHSGRQGSDDAFCQKSDRSAYGNCFCSSVPPKTMVERAR